MFFLFLLVLLSFSSFHSISAIPPLPSLPLSTTRYPWESVQVACIRHATLGIQLSSRAEHRSLLDSCQDFASITSAEFADDHLSLLMQLMLKLQNLRPYQSITLRLRLIQELSLFRSQTALHCAHQFLNTVHSPFSTQYFHYLHGCNHFQSSMLQASTYALLSSALMDSQHAPLTPQELNVLQQIGSVQQAESVLYTFGSILSSDSNVVSRKRPPNFHLVLAKVMTFWDPHQIECLRLLSSHPPLPLDSTLKAEACGLYRDTLAIQALDEFVQALSVFKSIPVVFAGELKGIRLLKSTWSRHAMQVVVVNALEFASYDRKQSRPDLTFKVMASARIQSQQAVWCLQHLHGQQLLLAVEDILMCARDTSVVAMESGLPASNADTQSQDGSIIPSHNPGVESRTEIPSLTDSDSTEPRLKHLNGRQSWFNRLRSSMGDCIPCRKQSHLNQKEVLMKDR